MRRSHFAKLTAKHNLIDDLIHLTLNELGKKIIADKAFVPPKAMNRREVIQKIGLASLAALLVIASLVASHFLHRLPVRFVRQKVLI